LSVSIILKFGNIFCNFIPNVDLPEPGVPDICILTIIYIYIYIYICTILNFQRCKLENLANKVLKYNKRIPLYNTFIGKKITTIKCTYGISNHNERKIKQVKNNVTFINNVSDSVEYIKCKQVILNIESGYKNILLGYFDDYIKMYNVVIYYFNNLKWKTDNITINFRNVRKIHVSEKKKYNAPSHVLDGAIKLACASFKSATTNKDRKHIKSFNLKPIKLTKKSKVIDIEQCYFQDEYIFKRFLKTKIPNSENYKYSNIKCDSKLHYDVTKDRFTLLIPIKIKIEQVATENQISIDMGERTFITGLTDNKIIEIGTDISKQLEKQLLRIDKYNTIIDNNKNITIKSIFDRLLCKKQTRNQQLKKRIKSIRLKMRNQIKDVQWKIVDYLTKTYKNITIGNWSTKGCIKNGISKIGKLKKRILNSLSVYKFKEKLKYKSEARGINLQFVDEAYTTQMCSYCSTLYPEIGASKTYDCKKCKRQLDRDVNSCRNMQMLGLI